MFYFQKQNIKVIAEYVSDLKILRYVKNIEIDYSQGIILESLWVFKNFFEIKIERATKKR